MPSYWLVIARWEFPPDSVDHFRGSLLELQRLSRLEEGNLQYEITRDLSNPDVVVILERYVSAAAFDAHRRSAHFVDIALAQIIPRLTSREVTQMSAQPAAPE